MNFPVNFCRRNQLSFPDCPEQHMTVQITTDTVPLDGEAFNVGEVIDFEITVINDGETDLYDVVIQYGDQTWTIGRLPVGTILTYYASHEVTAEDGDGGEYTATVIASSGSYEAEGSISVPCHNIVAAVLTYTYRDAPADGVAFNVGERITLDAVLTNTGTVPLTNITLTQTWIPGSPSTKDVLNPGEVWNAHVGNRKLREDEASSPILIETATAVIGSPDMILVADAEIPVRNDLEGDILLTKTVLGEPLNGEYYVEGESIGYVIRITNDANHVASYTINDPWLNYERTEDCQPGSNHGHTVYHTVTAEEWDETTLPDGWTVENEVTCVGTFSDGAEIDKSASVSFVNTIPK